MSTSRIFYYNPEIYTPQDMIIFVKKNGFDVQYRDDCGYLTNGGVTIVGTSISIRFPRTIGGIHGDVRWDTFFKIYFPEIRNLTEDEFTAYLHIHHGFGPKDEKLLKEHEKIYNNLKKKFQMKKDEQPKSIKDLDWLQAIKKYGYTSGDENKTAEEIIKANKKGLTKFFH